MMKTLQEWKAGQELEAVINELEDNYPTIKLGTNYSGGRLADFATGMGASDSDSSFNWDRVAGASGLMGTGSQHSDPALANRLKPLVRDVMKKNMKSGDRAAAVPETFKTFMTTVTTVVATVAHEMSEKDRGGGGDEKLPGPDPGWKDRVRRFNKEIAPDLRRRVSDQDQDDNGRDE
jgi:hypothetical protein